MPAKLHNPVAEQPLDARGVTWFIGVHFLALAAVYYLVFVQFSMATAAMAITMYFLYHLAITAGMHRLHSHRSYKAHRMLELVMLLLAAGTLQKSDLWWAYQHRCHHQFSDTERDPYTVRHGFWWAHVFWILRVSDEVDPTRVSLKDLLRNRLVMWQHQYYFFIAIPMALVLPTALAALWSDALGGLLVGGFLRLCLQYHGTWCINSVAHSVGPWRYSASLTARTCYWVLAFTVGEWNHEGHHIAEEDYRLGNRRWYDFDPGKWLIWLFSLPGITYDLKRVSDEDFERRLAHTRRLAVV